MHLQQSKLGKSGGPQYWLQKADAPVKEWLRKRGACEVILQTPYGVTGSPYMAVGRDHKLSGGNVVRGRAEHDRIQAAGRRQSIGETIRHWYHIRKGDLEKIEVEVSIDMKAGHFILIPTAVTMRGSGRRRTLDKVYAPLSFHHDYESRLWKEQIRKTRKKSASDVEWAASQIARVVAEHRNAKGIHEVDLLRSAGALAVLGLQLSPYMLKGYDCQRSEFCFVDLPAYQCPVEIKRQSKGFKYQMSRYKKLPRAVVLCVRHDLRNRPEHVDVIELSALARRLVG